jgi:hypothetical protein
MFAGLVLFIICMLVWLYTKIANGAVRVFKDGYAITMLVLDFIGLAKRIVYMMDWIHHDPRFSDIIG